MCVLFATIVVDSLASYETGLASLSLWQAGPDRTRLTVPYELLDGVSRVLISDIVGESPFQSWGGRFELRFYTGSLPDSATPAEQPLLSGEGFFQLAPEPSCDGTHVFAVLLTPAAR